MESFIEYNTIETIQTLPFFADKSLCSVTSLLPREHGNAVMRVATTDGCYVVRQGTRGESKMEAEYRAGSLAHAAGIAPEIFLFDADRALMVLEFIPGEHRTYLSREAIIRLAGTLRRLHAIPYQDEDIPHLDLRHLIDPDRPDIIEALSTLERFSPQLALCHHDLTPHNLLWNHHEPTLIDFEYAGIGDVCFDLAAVCVEFQLERESCSVFLLEYFGAAACPGEKLSAWETLYRALRRQWFSRHGIDQIS